MSNSDEHLIGSALMGLLTYAIVKPKMTGEQMSADEAIGVALVSGIVGIVPDALEPATNPWHRSFFHSYTGLGTLASVGERVIQDPK